MSKIENAETTRMLRDDELDFVSGGSSEEPTESISFNYFASANCVVQLRKS
jgi:hypothetical protein